MGNVNELKDFTRGQIDAVLMKIGHDVGMGTKEAIEAFLRGEFVVSRPARVWKTWMTIKLGTGLKTADDFRKALKAGRNNISDWVNNFLGKPAFTVSETERDVELVNVSVKELGFKKGACYADICKRALELGLDLCPAEVGPQLCLQWKDQPKGKHVFVVINVNTTSDGLFDTFRVGCEDNGERYFESIYGRVDVDWDAHDFFVFMRRPKSV